MIFVVLYKCLNPTTDYTIDSGHTLSTYSNTYYIIIILMLFITAWCKPLETNPSREICAYAT